MWKPMVYGLTDYKEEGDFICTDINDYRHTMRKKEMEGFLWQTLSPPQSLQKQQPKQKAIEENS